MEQPWSRGVHERIARAVRTLRGNRSAQWLADRTAELGHPITRAQITNYENGRKASLDIADLIVLAAALNTSPVVLVYPGPYSDEVEVVPGRQAPTYFAADWFSGLGYWWVIEIPAEDAVSDELWRTSGRAWINSTRAINGYRRLRETEMMRADALRRGDAERDPEQIAFYDRTIQYLLRDLEPDLLLEREDDA